MNNDAIFKIRSFNGRGILRLRTVTVCFLIFWQTVTFRRRFLPPFSGKLQVLAEGLLGHEHLTCMPTRRPPFDEIFAF